MTQSPKRPYSLATARGKLRIYGSSGEEGEGAEPEGGEGGGEEKSPEAIAAEKKIKDLEKERDDFKQKHQDEKKRADAAEKAQVDKDREGMEEHERTEAERDDFKEKYEKLLKIVETSVIDTAITNLSLQKDKSGKPKYDWHDVEAVRTFLDKENIKLDLDTGVVDGLDTQLADIAKKRSYLLVSKQESDDEPSTPPGGPATGGHPTGGTTRTRETDRTKLGAKYKLPGFVGAGSNIGARPM